MPGDQILPVNDLRRSWVATSPEVRDVVERVLSGGRYVLGEEHDQFEVELGSMLGVSHVAAVANGTDALVLAMQALGLEVGSEIVTAANAGGYASTAAAQLGARVVYADIDPSSLLVTPETVASAIGPSTSAVVVTHLYGNIADTAAIAEVCRPHGIRVIEDCAQAIGGLIGGRRAGSIGDVSTFSFYPTKNLGGAGDGGAVATNDPSIDASIRSLRQYGWDGRYRISRRLGRNSRLDELQAAILRLGLPKIDALNQRRRDIVDQYRQAVAGSRFALVTGAGCETVAHLGVIRVPERDGLRDHLKAGGIGTDIHYPIADHRQTGLPAPARVTDLLRTEAAVGQILTLPCFPGMTADEVDRVCGLLVSSTMSGMR